jgi:hypothetical protein
MNINMESQNIDLHDIKRLKSKIETLDSTEQFEIIKILNKNNYTYTKNNNGYFINMNNISSDIIDEINKFIDFSNKNNELLINDHNERMNLQI